MARGFTLIELLITIGLMSLLASLAAPSFTSITQAARLDAQSQRLMDALWYTRSQAISRGTTLTLRAINQDWSQGWHIVSDRHDDTQSGTDQTILRAGLALPVGYTLNANRGIGTAIGYRADGRSVSPSGGLQMGTLTLCRQAADGGLIAEEIIVISATGRPRRTRQPSAIAGRDCTPND
ncbi:MAG: GspH/FimT family pseudopilin [Spiribacter sp.]|nr:GspH/FimT family pseudopilin [Spiribacter sp.]